MATETQVFYPQASKTDVDFFKIPEDKLVAHGYKVEKKIIELGVIRRIDRDFLEANGLDPDKRETVVFNLPTNAGKSRTTYELVQHYHQQGTYLVIVCSPFIKLVEKDVHELRNTWGVPVFNYKDLKKGVDVDEAVSNNVHVMTVNCLLANGGDVFDQEADKLAYVSMLRDRVNKEKLKVVLFFDEIHAGVQNFESQQLPYLALWRKHIQKIYVASATHTVSSYAIIKYMGRLTDGVIQIFESDRARVNPTPAALFIHMTTQCYTKDDLAGLDILVPILEESSGKWVNILVAQKGLAEAMKKDKESPFYELLKDYNLTTGDVKSEFAYDKNNIGTTFKTGIDICDKENVFIVILPNPGNFDTASLLNDNNIFADGAPSIIQAFGRQREGGICHVIMGKPRQHIKETKLLDEHRSPVKIFRGAGSAYKKQNVLLDVIIDDYEKKTKELQDAIHFFRTERCGSNVEGVTAHYPMLQEYLLHPGQIRLANTELSAGQGLYPYLLWAGVNNQFGNVDLKAVHYYEYSEGTLVLGTDYDVNVESLTNFFPDLHPSSNICVPQAFDIIYKELFVAEKDYKFVIKTLGDETIDAKKANQLTRRILFLTTIKAVGAGASFPLNVKKDGPDIGFEKWYLRCMLDGHYKKLSDKSELKQCYNVLHDCREQFYAFIQHVDGVTIKQGDTICLTHKKYIPAILPISQAETLLTALNGVVEKDPFFIHDVGKISIPSASDEDSLKEKAFELGRMLFTSIQNNREDGKNAKKRVVINGRTEQVFILYNDWKYTKAVSGKIQPADVVA